ncbi:MAG: metabolite traffic protein EboE, partial [Akkermansiaceae bacterium]|nr:metabolite traffic protein EboE [Akkermansiaceae bacterium]
MKFNSSHLAYCTNIHPAESWEETRIMLENHVLKVRDLLRSQGRLGVDEEFAIGLRLSAVAAEELLQGDNLEEFKAWLSANQAYVFTINGFPYGSFHGTRVKEKVFQPDWTEPARVEYTKNLFRILAEIAKPEAGGSVSTLPGSHKTFSADESIIRENLIEFSLWLEDLTKESGIDLHLGLEPEPIGHIENTAETIAFFERLHEQADNPSALSQRIGLNYDTCHFAIEFDNATSSLYALQ